MKNLFSSLFAVLILARGASAETELITPTGTWDYLHPTTGVDPAAADADFATTWYTYGGSYNGPAFTAGKPGPFSYGGIDYFTGALAGTFIGTGGTAMAPASGSRYTAYFKKQITLAEGFPATIVRMLADDGAIIYIDGVERKRVNMTGTVAGNTGNGSGDSYTMLADDTVSEMVLTPDFSIGPISAGPHVIAVSLHNALPTSSDLGMLFQLFGVVPPMLRVNTGGTFTEVPPVPGSTGWTSAAGVSYTMNSAIGTHDIESAPVDLSTTGAVYFSMQVYCHEVSPDSNFEATDEFGAKLMLTFDDDTATELPLVPVELDLDLNGVLNGEEFNPNAFPDAKLIFVARQFTATIPANVKSVSLKVSGTNNSASPTETLGFGGALISDVVPGSDEDGDGVSREAELFSGTDPVDPLSALRTTDLSYALNSVSGDYEIKITGPLVGGKHYAVEQAEESADRWTFLGSIVSGGTGTRTVVINLGPTPPPRLILRLRCIP